LAKLPGKHRRLAGPLRPCSRSRSSLAAVVAVVEDIGADLERGRRRMRLAEDIEVGVIVVLRQHSCSCPVSRLQLRSLLRQGPCGRWDSAGSDSFGG
jgi:hypothetical protein